MKRSDYASAASFVERQYRDVLDELTEQVLETAGADPVLGRDIETLLESYSRRFWNITCCLQQLEHAASKKQPTLDVAQLDCSHDSVKLLLSEWLSLNSDASIVSLSILDNVERLTCIIVFHRNFRDADQEKTGR